VLGIVGRNGSGKSTLLKILSRITKPSSGKISLKGRVASLLEVGTGFHGELTGRENIFLNGVLLGMSRREVSAKFDEIVSFADVEKFLDTPAKRYSSGMLLRLAFAVAAHLEPEILIIDEVLAVGDFEFQKKCIKTMGELGKSGRTILFVSHNIGAVRRLCNKGLFLSKGNLLSMGGIEMVTEKYMMHGKEQKSITSWNERDAPQDALVRLIRVSVLDKNAKTKDAFSLHESLFINVEYELKASGNKTSLILYFYNSEGSLLFVTSDSSNTIWQDRPRKSGFYKSVCEIPGDFFNNGEITVSLSFFITGVECRLSEENVVAFSMTDDMQPTGARGDYIWDWPQSAVRPALTWKFDQHEL
jgi:lipopolysaccharide transport system ATP-binding protein